MHCADDRTARSARPSPPGAHVIAMPAAGGTPIARSDSSGTCGIARRGCLQSTTGKLTMTKKIVLLLAMLSFGLMPLAGCNTVQGAGKDVERAGQKVQDEAVEHKKY